MGYHMKLAALRLLDKSFPLLEYLGGVQNGTAIVTEASRPGDRDRSREVGRTRR